MTFPMTNNVTDAALLSLCVSQMNLMKFIMVKEFMGTAQDCGRPSATEEEQLNRKSR